LVEPLKNINGILIGEIYGTKTVENIWNCQLKNKKKNVKKFNNNIKATVLNTNDRVFN